MKLPKYQRQVQTSGQGVGQTVNREAVAQAAGADSSVLANALQQAGELIGDLGVKTHQQEEKVLGAELENTMKIANETYEKKRVLNKNRNQWGTEEDKDLKNLQTVYSKILEDPRLKNHGRLTKVLQINQKQSLLGYAVGGQLDAAELNNDELRGLQKAQYEQFIKEGRVDDANALLLEMGSGQYELSDGTLANGDGTFSDAEIETFRLEQPRVLEQSTIISELESNPDETIKKIDEQIQDGIIHYQHHTNKELKAFKNNAIKVANDTAVYNQDTLTLEAYQLRDNNDIEGLQLLRERVVEARDNKQIKPTDAETLLKFIDDPFGDDNGVITSASIKAELFTRAANYNSELDNNRQEYQEIFSLIAQLDSSDPTRSELIQLLNNSRDGKIESSVYKQVMDRIDQDAKLVGLLDNESVILSGLGYGGKEQARDFVAGMEAQNKFILLAKKEVFSYLQQHPQDLKGALALYESLLVPEKERQTVEVFRRSLDQAPIITGEQAGEPIFSETDLEKFDSPWQPYSRITYKEEDIAEQKEAYKFLEALTLTQKFEMLKENGYVDKYEEVYGELPEDDPIFQLIKDNPAIYSEEPVG